MKFLPVIYILVIFIFQVSIMREDLRFVVNVTGLQVYSHDVIYELNVTNVIPFFMDHFIVL